MEFADSPEEAEFRRGARAFLETSLPRLAWPEPHGLVDRVPFWREWQRMLRQAGYAGLTWSVENGGRGLDERMRAIFIEECDRAGAPERLNIVGEDFAGPTIAHFGSEEQRARFLPRILAGEDIWCQLFSEPDAGSDLAAVRTKAEKVDGGWRVSGQKVWTSRAQIATHGILLARTGAAGSKGLSFFLVPMTSPGISVRPIAHMLGEAEFNQVSLDDVFVEDGLLVGEVNRGWEVALTTLAFERVAIATGRVNTAKAVEDLVTEVRSRRDADGRRLGEDPHVRRRIAELWSRAFVHHAISQRVISTAVAGGPPGPVTSIGKLYFCPLVEELSDFGLWLDPLGDQFGLDDEDPEAVGRSRRWLRLANQARGTSIAGGSTFIQRNIVAERVLGLPRR